MESQEEEQRKVSREKSKGITWRQRQKKRRKRRKLVCEEGMEERIRGDSVRGKRKKDKRSWRSWEDKKRI